MSLIKKIKQYYKKPKYLFTTPSHSQGEFIIPESKKLFGKKFFKMDFSEIDGFDNLRTPKGILKKLQRDLAKIYDTKATFMLTNGSSSGVIAAINTVVKENEKVLIARNCHISVYNALVLSGAKPIWFLPEFDEEWGIYKGVKASAIENKINKNKNIKALIITSPTYEGENSEIEKISQICKKHNIVFIVDEAHGALLNFAEFKAKPSIQLGADISIQSLHKTCGAPNPSALLHINKNSIIIPEDIQTSLNLINTTSPSYVILCAIESTVKYLNSINGRKRIKSLISDIESFKNKLNKRIQVYQTNDPTKLLIKINGVATENISKILNKCFDIEEEYTSDNALLFITGIGTTKRKLNKLKIALNDIAQKTKTLEIENIQQKYSLPQIAKTPRQAFICNTKIIKTTDSIGKICGEIIISYPPGIPTILPGEIITFDNVFNIEKDEIKIIE